MMSQFERHDESSAAILIVEDHPLFTEALCELFRELSPGTTIYCVTSLAEARGAIQHSHFRLALIDLMLPDGKGLDVAISLQALRPTCPMAIVSAREDPEWMRRAARLGFLGYIPKSAPVAHIRLALTSLLAGIASFPARVFAEKTASNRETMLSRAEQRILAAAADGGSNKEIARLLDIREATVKSHFTRIFRKLGVSNRTQALIAIARNGDRLEEFREP